MSASIGVVEVIVSEPRADEDERQGCPTPSSAVMSGSPAARNEPKVRRSTRARHDAEQLGDADAVALCENSWPPTDDLRSVGQSGLERRAAAWSASEVAGSTAVAPTESWIGTSAAEWSALRFALGRRVVR